MNGKIRIAFVVVAAIFICCASLWAFARWPVTADDPDLGTLHRYPAWFGERGLVYLFSDGAWRDKDSRTALRFARAGWFAVGVDSKRLLELIDSSSDCTYLAGSLEGFSRDHQRKMNLKSYREPALLGSGMGAALVYVAQVQAPPLSFSAAIARDPNPLLTTRQTFCNLTASTNAPREIQPQPRNDSVPLLMWATADTKPEVSRFVAAAYAGQASFVAPKGNDYDIYRAALDRIAAEQTRSTVSDLPLVEVEPAQATQPAFAIVYSGDGGWRDLDQTLAGVLANKGMPVVGVDTLRYFWHEAAPEQAAHDLARTIRYYQQHWQRQKVVLIGFSFGADILPFLINRLPVELQADVQTISLLSPSRTTAFEVDPANWVGLDSIDKRHAIEPEFKLLPKAKVQCVYGTDEALDSLCTLPEAHGAQVLRKSGGHHFDENYDGLADDILTAARN